MLRRPPPEKLVQHYTLLGVAREASVGAIRRKYRRLVKAWHPDQFLSDPERYRLAEQKLKAINEAYEHIQGAPLRSAGRRTATRQTVKVNLSDTDEISWWREKHRRRDSVFALGCLAAPAVGLASLLLYLSVIEPPPRRSELVEVLILAAGLLYAAHRVYLHYRIEIAELAVRVRKWTRSIR